MEINRGDLTPKPPRWEPGENWVVADWVLDCAARCTSLEQIEHLVPRAWRYAHWTVRTLEDAIDGLRRGDADRAEAAARRAAAKLLDGTARCPEFEAVAWNAVYAVLGLAGVIRWRERM